MKKVNRFSISFCSNICKRFCVSIYLLSVCSLLPATIYAETSKAGQAAELLERYYSGQDIPVKEALELYNKTKQDYETSKIVEKEEAALCYIASCTVLSSLYSSGTLQQHEALVTGLQAELEQNIRLNTASASVLLGFADFLYSQFAWKKDNFSVIAALPLLYRKILLKDPQNKEAQVKLAVWYTNAGNYYSRSMNGFVISQEPYLDLLQKHDRFNAYISYSSFYLKIYDTQKAYDYLAMAKDLYPDNIICAIIEANYANGKTGF